MQSKRVPLILIISLLLFYYFQFWINLRFHRRLNFNKKVNLNELSTKISIHFSWFHRLFLKIFQNVENIVIFNMEEEQCNIDIEDVSFSTNTDNIKSIVLYRMNWLKQSILFKEESAKNIYFEKRKGKSIQPISLKQTYEK